MKYYYEQINGAVTVFACLIFLLIISLISATITSARTHAARVFVATSSSMAIDSYFSQYNVTLRDRYGILLREYTDTSSATDEISEYIDKNLKPEGNVFTGEFTDLYGINVLHTTISQNIKATDYNGLIWEKMVVDYEKLYKTADVIGDYTGIEEEVKSANTTGDICNDLCKCAQDAVAINDRMLGLVSIIDGVSCPTMGIDLSDINIHDYYLKVTDRNHRTGITQIDEELIKTFISAYDIVNKILQELDQYIEFGSKDDLNQAIISNEELNELLSQLKLLTTEGIAEINSIDQLRNSLKENIESVEYVITNTDNLSSSISKSLAEEVEQLRVYTETDYSQFCDLVAISKVLNNNINTINAMLSCYRNINREFTYMDAESYKGDLYKLLEYFDGYTTKEIKFDYSGLLSEEGSGDESDSIKESLESAILDLATPDGKVISSSEIDYADLASSLGKSGKPADLSDYEDEYNSLLKMALYNEYVFDKMSSFTDNKKDGSLKYEIEYILYGNNSDQRNMEELITSIVNVRSGLNMAYIITDTAKKQEAYTAAAAMIGFTGIAPLITILQYTLLYLWSYAEAIVDAKSLLSGNKVPIIKNSSQWNLSIKNLLSCNLSVNNKSDKGLNYEHYLRLFMYWNYDCMYFYRTMDVIELNMIDSNASYFRLNNYLYGATICTKYLVPGANHEFIDYEAFTY